MDPFIFLHIPKTAGTTINSILFSNFPKEHICYCYANKANDMWEPIERIRNMSEGKRKAHKVVISHHRFGLHRLFGSEYKYFTLFRNPVDRIVSHYHYVKRTPDHYLYGKIRDANMSLYDYAISRISTELDNGQVRMIANDFDDTTLPFGMVDENLLHKAKMRLDKYFISFGIQDRFDESLALFKVKNNLRSIAYVSQNVTKSRSEISKQSLEAINEITKYDQFLYQYALSKFDEQVSANSMQVKKELYKMKFESSVLKIKGFLGRRKG